MKKNPSKKDKPINWRLALKRAKEQEFRDDAGKVVALIQELHHIVCVKQGMKSHRKVRVESTPN